MADHWIDPRSRGLWSGPAYHPPQPQPPSNNNVSARLSAVEIHLYYAVEERKRIEAEALARAADNTRILTDIVDRVEVMESSHATVSMVASWAPWVVKWLASVVIFAVLIGGRLSGDGGKAVLAVLGLASG